FTTKEEKGKDFSPRGLTGDARRDILPCINRGTGRVHRPLPFSASRGRCKRGRAQLCGMVPGGRTERGLPSVGETGESTPLPRAGTCWSALSGRVPRQAGWHRRSIGFCPC